MKCINPQKHFACKFAGWNKNETEKLCVWSLKCEYTSKYIYFENINEDTPMYHGKLDGLTEVKTKAEWRKIFGHNDFQLKYDEAWYTASLRTARADLCDLSDLIDYIAKRDEMYDSWGINIFGDCKNDPVVVAGIKRLNEIFAENPTYIEDQQVIFDHNQLEKVSPEFKNI